ncbi:hypothetical protein FBU30_011281 [Linnemannia zychae]|nr:hypothetical protein FBU30_011281 [Linnemannia zychae]
MSLAPALTILLNMKSTEINKGLKAFFIEINDIEKTDQFEFFVRVTKLQQCSAESTRLAGLKALAQSKQPKFVNPAEILQKKYDTSQKNGLLKSYWKKRSAEEELIEEADDAANETAKCVVRSSRLKARRAFNVIDSVSQMPIPGIKDDAIGNDLVDDAAQENAYGNI